MLERKSAFDRYVRKGDTGALDALELKAMSAGSPADGGYTVPLEMARLMGVATPMLDLLAGMIRLRARAAGLYSPA